MTIKLAVFGSTKGTDLQAVIDAIANGELNASIEVVISNKEDAYILERARNHNIPALHIPAVKGETREQYDQRILHQLTNYHIDLILLIGWMRILSPLFVRAYPRRIMNVHPSLLPKFAGGMDLDVHDAVLKAGEKETGCTVHWVDEGVDTGEIIIQKKCTVEPDDTPETLRARVQKLEGLALIEAIGMMRIYR